MVYFISNQKRISTNTNEIQEATIQDCLEYFKNKDIIEVDTETERSKWSSNVDRLPDPYTAKVLCIQLGDKDNQFVEAYFLQKSLNFPSISNITFEFSSYILNIFVIAVLPLCDNEIFCFLSSLNFLPVNDLEILLFHSSVLSIVFDAKFS